MEELVGLGEVSAAEMEDVLAHECQAWADALEWDYAATSALIARAVESRTFAGFALRERRRVVGYIYFLADPVKSVLGSGHALPRAEAAGAVERLVGRALEHLIDEVGTRRIESQFLYLGHERPEAIFAARGLVRFKRQYLIGDVAPVAARLTVSPFAVRPFRVTDIKAAAEIIYRSFAGSIEAAMSDCYSSVEGCEAYVEAVLSRSGCGTYEERGSFLALEHGQPVGVILVSRLSPGVAHVVQVSVAPTAQGRGAGQSLLGAACRGLAARGFRRLSLSVSTGNPAARDWYLALGLTVRWDYAAFVWTA